jgi:SAM-dependent methyltransferase
MGIEYKHSENLHTLAGPQAALPVIFGDSKPSSVLDVGCGTGTWLKAALELGISDIFGVDGVEAPFDQLHIPAEKIQRQDLTRPWVLERRFSVAICFEVGEHLDRVFAGTLIDTLVKHSDLIYFSAACPGQPGQHHVNCQWPAYWQKLYNERGYVCSDDVRWRIWDDARIEPWYRQNLFVARRDALAAGTEPRIKPVVHPGMMAYGMNETFSFEEHVKQIESGKMLWKWYLQAPVRALRQKLKRRLP